MIRLSKNNDTKLLIAKVIYNTKQEELLGQYNKRRIKAIEEQMLLEFKAEEETLNSIKKSQQKIIEANDFAADAEKRRALEGFALTEKKLADLDRLKEATTNWLQSFSAEFFENSGMGSLTTFFDGTFDKLMKGAANSKEEFAVAFNAMAEVAQDAFNRVQELGEANFQNENDRLDRQKTVALKYAGDSESAKAKIVEDYDKKRRAIEVRENKARQKMAIFNIAIDTAQGIVAALAKTNVPLSILIGVMGAAQIAAVAAQEIPQYFEGGVHNGGLAMINDAKGSNYVETVVTPDGKVSQYSGRDVVTNLPKGTEIFTPEQWKEQEIYNMMEGKANSISFTNKASEGMTAAEMDQVMSKHFKKIQVNNTTFDRNGIISWTESNGNKAIRSANRVSRTGFNV